MLNARTDKVITPYSNELKLSCAAFATGKVSYCSGLAYSDLDMCVTLAAASARVVSLCNGVSNRSYVSCVSYVAAAENDVSICDSKTDSKLNRGTCYGLVATKNNRIGLCDLIEDKSAKNQCFYDFAVLLNVSSACDKMTADWVDDCKQMVEQNFPS